jgi:NAD(P)-dependent dehydrogenase (short-subunit alcohol dehydrogenase family)
MKTSLIIAAILLFSCISTDVTTAAENEKSRKAVLVTGASSGIGLKITELLAANDYHVYAGARKPEDLERLDEMDNVSSVRLDVTVNEDIENAVEFIGGEGRGLYGVVNNAGVGSVSTLVSGPESDLEFTFGVNVYGPYRINRAFLPMLMDSNGRTTIIGSISGFIASRSGIYSMSKFAVEAYTDSLARQLADTGVHVSIVEPGGYRSEFRSNRAARTLAAAERGEIELTEEQRARLENARERQETLKEPDEVAEAVLELLASDNPKRRYMVTPNKEQADATIRAALTRVVQLNTGHKYSYERDELVELLDELLAEHQR